MNARMESSSLFVVTRTNVTRVDADDARVVRGRAHRRRARDVVVVAVVSDDFIDIMVIDATLHSTV